MKIVKGCVCGVKYKIVNNTYSIDSLNSITNLKDNTRVYYPNSYQANKEFDKLISELNK